MDIGLNTTALYNRTNIL
jgi:hypothetical protein